MKSYRVIRVDWDLDKVMSDQINEELKETEEVEQMAASDDQLILLAVEESEL